MKLQYKDITQEVNSALGLPIFYSLHISPYIYISFRCQTFIESQIWVFDEFGAYYQIVLPAGSIPIKTWFTPEKSH